MELKIKKSHVREEWIVYDPNAFLTRHTHCRHKRVAIKIKWIVEHRQIPTSHDLSFIASCIRVSDDILYKVQLQEYLLRLQQIKHSTYL